MKRAALIAVAAAILGAAATAGATSLTTFTVRNTDYVDVAGTQVACQADEVGRALVLICSNGNQKASHTLAVVLGPDTLQIVTRTDAPVYAIEW